MKDKKEVELGLIIENAVAVDTAMEVFNHTELSTARIEEMFARATSPWTAPGLKVVVRYSRSAVYSGTFAFKPPRIYVNLGRRNKYPLRADTSVARAKTIGQSWWKPTCYVNLADPYQLALFVFLHEFYHYLIHRAHRNPRRKEAMCDRFAVKYLVDHCRLTVFDTAGRPVPRRDWLFQNLHAFVADNNTLLRPAHAARRPRTAMRSAGGSR